MSQKWLFHSIFVALICSGCANSVTDNKSGSDKANKSSNSASNSGSKQTQDCSKEDCKADEGSEVLSGMNLFALNYSNARIHCNSTLNGGGSYNVTCDGYAHQEDGTEKKATEIEPGTSITWLRPTSEGLVFILGGSNCFGGKETLSSTCEITVSGASKVTFALELTKDANVRKETVGVAFAAGGGN